MKEDADIRKDLERSVGDYAHSGVRAGISTTPFIGGALAEFFSVVITPPLEKRRDEWIIKIYERLKLVEDTVEGFKIENLANDENFISTLFYATNIAMRTHQSEKLEALRNVVTKSALNPDMDESLQLIFLNLVDQYTPWHLKILLFFDDPRGFGEKIGVVHPHWTGGSASTILEHTFPELKGRRDFYDKIVKDLSSDGLLQSGEYLHAQMSAQGMFTSRTSNLGKQFLTYIESPKIESE